MTRSERLKKCTDCGRLVRGSNLARHRRTHVPMPEDRGSYTKLLQPRRPITQGRNGDRRYDEAFPRGEGSYRYRLYRLRGGELQLIGAAPDGPSAGLALVTFDSEGEFIVDDSFGLLDTITDPGHWVASPFALGRRRQVDG